ncbi:uncharacterized protein LOC108327328 [Vigna angularis]|uniref:uncharacterized protein LOC108327328 n=1 Tax=Phaseolus angularis TaxID=3914 RepID=UPI0022B34DF6|nr:uncharacterized protein LOC108327328 [Vigna angularis]
MHRNSPHCTFSQHPYPCSPFSPLLSFLTLALLSFLTEHNTVTEHIKVFVFAPQPQASSFSQQRHSSSSSSNFRPLFAAQTLSESWIYEHFPTLGRRRLVCSYDEDIPRDAKWESSRQGEVKVHLDALTYDSVIWYPYESHRETRPFYDIY